MNDDNFYKDNFTPTIRTVIFMIALQCTMVSAGCPDQFENYRNLTCVYYQGYDTPSVTWTEARLACRSRGMSTLATVVDRDLENWMVTKWMNRPLTGPSTNPADDICNRRQSAWIGLVRAGYRGSEWTWDDPDAISAYRNWHPNEPNNAQNIEDCTILIFDKTPAGGRATFDWYDSPCDLRRDARVWCNRASGFFCSAPYAPDVPTASPDVLVRAAQQNALNDAYSKTETANNALWITLFVLSAIVLSFVGFAIWKYKGLIKGKATGNKTASTEQLSGD